jgi:hypothetical protein
MDGIALHSKALCPLRSANGCGTSYTRNSSTSQSRETSMLKAIVWIVGILALIGLLVVAGCFKAVF